MNTERLLEGTLQKVLSSCGDQRTILDGVKVPEVSTSSLEVFGIDRATLQALGLDKTAQDRVYKVLYIQSDGFFNFLKEQTSEQARQSIWRVFLRLTESNFKSISAVDSVLRKQYEDTLHSLLAEHDETMRTSQMELEEAQRQLTETALKEAEVRHQALLDKKLTQARTMQLEEQNASLIIELEQERLTSANQEREIFLLRESLETQKKTILELEAGTERLSKVSEDLISVTAAWTRLNEENQKLESEHQRMKGERDRVVQMTGGEIKKSDSLASQVEASQAKIAALTKDLVEKCKSFNLLKSEHAALASLHTHVLHLFRKAHEESNQHDRAFQALFQVLEGAVDRKISLHSTLSSADVSSDVVGWSSSVHAAFSSIPRGRFVEQATSIWERLCSTLNELQQTNNLLALAQRRSAAAEYIGNQVWQRSVVRLEGQVSALQAEGKKNVSEMERALGALHTVQESLKKVHKGNDQAEKMAAEMALLKIDIVTSRHDCNSFKQDLIERGNVIDKQAELIAKLNEDLALAQIDIASLKTAKTALAEIERKQKVDLERKSRDLDAINLSNTQLSSVFTALNSELSSLVENVLGTVAAVESGHILSADALSSTKPTSTSLRSCSAAIEEDDSLLPQEKACIQAVIGFTLTLQKELKRVSIIAQQTNKLKAEATAAVKELQKLKAWAGRERQRLHSEFEHKLLEAEGLSQQKDLLAEQLQRDRKDLLSQITDLRAVNNSGLQKMEQLIAQLRALELEEVNRIIDPPAEPETVEEEKKEDTGVDWGFDQHEEEPRPAEYASFDSTFPSKPTAPKPTNKSPLEQLRL